MRLQIKAIELSTSRLDHLLAIDILLNGKLGLGKALASLHVVLRINI
jgi:hypothetical protein